MVLYPENLRKQIDETNAWTYDNVNNGVYKCGFATTQEAYEKAIKPLFNALDKVEKHLSSSEGSLLLGQAYHRRRCKTIYYNCPL